MNFVCLVFELGDKTLTLSPMENLMVKCNQLGNATSTTSLALSDEGARQLGNVTSTTSLALSDEGARQLGNATSTTSLALSDEELLLMCSFLLKVVTIMHLWHNALSTLCRQLLYHVYSYRTFRTGHEQSVVFFHPGRHKSTST